MSLNNFKSFIYSMCTAILTGISLAFIFILLNMSFSNPYSFDLDFNKNIDNLDNDFLNKENEIDPTYSSHLSNSIIYSSNNNFEIKSKKSDLYPREAVRYVSAKAYMVINISDDKVILQKNQETSLPIASITKLVTAVVSRKLLDQDEYIVMDSDILRTYGNEGKFRLGEKIKISELLYPLLMVSSNDAGEAIASSYSLGRKKFIKEMNNWANEIGAYRTYFSDPSGLSARNLSTVNDISIIIKWILENDPEILNITGLKTKDLRTHTWTNPTHFLNLSAYIGGKNGYTPEADRTGVSLFKLGKDKKIFMFIILGSSMRDNDTLDLLEEAIR